MMEKRYKADNGPAPFYWGALILVLTGYTLYRFFNSQVTWPDLLYILFAIFFTISITIKEYVITEFNFIEVRFLIRFLSKKKRIAIGDIIGLKKLKKNELRIDLVRGFEVIKVKDTHIDALILELRERNPRIKMPDEN